MEAAGATAAHATTKNTAKRICRMVHLLLNRDTRASETRCNTLSQLAVIGKCHELGNTVAGGSQTAAIVEETPGNLLQGGHERTPMKIRITVNQSADRSPCAHRGLTLAGRSMRLQGLALKRSTERYTCNACGKPLVRTLNSSWSYRPLPNHHTTETSPSDTER